MTLTPEQIAALAAALAVVIVGLLKLIPGFAATPKLTKMVTAGLAATLTVLVAAQWHFTPETGWQIVQAIFLALIGYKGIAAPLRTAITGK